MHKTLITPAIKKLTGSRKKNVYISVVKDGHVQNTASYWDGGSREYFTGYVIQEHGQIASVGLPTGSFPNFEANHPMQVNEFIIQTGIFMGKPATPHIYIQRHNADIVFRLLGLPETNYLPEQ